MPPWSARHSHGARGAVKLRAMATVWTTKRLWIPFVLAALCLLVASFCGPVLTVVLMITALGLVLDGATLLWSRSGGMAGHRQ